MRAQRTPTLAGALDEVAPEHELVGESPLVLASYLDEGSRLPVPGRHATGALVGKAAAKAVDLDKLSLDEMQAVEPGFTKDIYKVLTVEASVAARKSYGGTAPSNVARAVKAARKRSRNCRSSSFSLKNRLPVRV